MSIQDINKGSKSEAQEQIELMEERMEQMLGPNTGEVIKRLSSSNGGDIANTLRYIKGHTDEETLRKFVGLYTEAEYLKAIEDDHQHRPEKVRKDLISIKLVLREFNNKFSPNIEPDFMETVNRKLQELNQ